MCNEIDQVRKFYSLIWEQNIKSVIPDVLTEDIKFRGSLGNTMSGIEKFSEYVDMIHAALDNYTCSIEEIVVNPPKIFAKMKFSGVHSGIFLGFEPTGAEISWAGAALFTFKAGKISDLWVLGDVKALEAQLSGHK